MRAYFFGNMYLSSIQQGIQALHVVSEMFSFENDPFKRKLLTDWGKEHKTVVLLNGGYARELYDIKNLLNTINNPFPWAVFHEEEAALDGAITSVGIILPPKIYIGAKMIREKEIELSEIEDSGRITFDLDGELITDEVSKFEFMLMQRLNQYGIAR